MKTVNIKAFFLLEVMLTLAILSIGLVYVIRSMSTSLQAARTVFDHNQAVHCVYEKMNEFELFPEYYTLDNQQQKKASGIFEQNNNFKWAYELEKDPEYNLSSLALEVTWQEAKRSGAIGVTTYIRTKEAEQ